MDLRNIDSQEIIKKLKEFAPNLPESGFVAGGAVAALLNHRIRGVNSPVRDVDLFLPAEADSMENSSPQFLPTDIVFDGYFGRIVDTGYRITKTVREGNTNTIYCDAGTESFELEVLRGFDINCCQAGVDLSTGKLFYTHEFEDFLSSAEVHITNVGTPFLSAMRLFKKTKDMSASCNYYKELRVLFSAILLLNPDYKSQRVPLQNLSFLDPRERETLRVFFDIDEDTPFVTMSVRADMKNLLWSDVGSCTCAIQFMAKIRALRENRRHILPLLDEPVAYQIPNYLRNYRDVTLGDIENRRDDGLAIRMGWNIGEHCQYSRYARFESEITEKISSSIKETTYRKIADSQQLDINQNTDKGMPPIASPISRAITSEDIMALLNFSPPAREESSLLRQLKGNNLFEISLQREINRCVVDHFIQERRTTINFPGPE